MSDWQVGDLALCIRDPEGELDVSWNPVPGSVYRIAGVDFSGPGLLDLAEYPDKFNPHAGWCQYAFTKVTPPEADEFDREVIEQMNGAPVEEPV